MRRRVLLMAAATVVVATASGVILEYATETSPAWLSVDPWRRWLLLGVLVLLAVVLAMVTVWEPAVAQPGSSAPTSPRFPVAPASLRAPRVDVVLGRTDELTELAYAIRQRPKKRREQFKGDLPLSPHRWIVQCGPQRREDVDFAAES